MLQLNGIINASGSITVAIGAKLLASLILTHYPPLNQSSKASQNLKYSNKSIKN